jgi:hypothetical protein
MIKFTSKSAYEISDAIIKGMEGSKKAMEEEGLWNDKTTFEEWAQYAGSHIEIREIDENIK